MRRVEPPAGFADRVLARAEAPPARVLGWPVRVQRVAMRWGVGALAAGVLLGSVTGLEVERRHRQRVEAADREFALAGQVTQRALEEARAQLSRSGVRLVE